MTANNDSVSEIPRKDIEMDAESFARGASGEVYKAKWRHKSIVVKVIKTYDDEEREDVMREAKLTFLLKHKNVINLFGITQVTNKQLGIVMEEAEHGSLDMWIGKVDQEQLTKIALGIVVGLTYVHSQNVMHRDIKPKNILMFGPKDDMIPKIADFGSAKIIKRVTQNTKVGDVHYMAPEVAQYQQYGFPADIFSLAVMLFEMFNEQLMSQAPVEVKRFIITAQSPGGKVAKTPKSSKVPACLRQIIERGLNGKPELRPTPGEYQAALRGKYCLLYYYVNLLKRSPVN